ncbi:MAG: hypothetical protein CMI54_04735 [Parcubacteria group bacterium]|nr:hypothetical protein [Parcubacteria group bacterium]|tara:strand:+ start:37067 stop:37309 length:243 start_codon:yes stop_codon:yes gene_type:complete
MTKLTDRQAEVLSVIDIYIDENGFSPSLLDVANGMEILPNAAQDHLKALEKKGYITRVPKISRSITITEVGQDFLRSYYG